MSRQKCKRCISFRPNCHRFLPDNDSKAEIITLLSEETEALYLMDLLGMYQEEAALKMEVSRPTLARIIKSAHQKVALALLNGKQLCLEASREPYRVALCSDSESAPYISLHPKSRYIHIFTLNHHAIESREKLNNPLFTEEIKPSITLTNIFMHQRINLFITNGIGEGFKSMLSSKGINLLYKESTNDEEIKALW